MNILTRCSWRFRFASPENPALESDAPGVGICTPRKVRHCLTNPRGQAVAMEVQVATRSDIPAIMLVERGEGYARLVGRWEAEQHAAEIESPSNRYLLA